MTETKDSNQDFLWYMLSAFNQTETDLDSTETHPIDADEDEEAAREMREAMSEEEKVEQTNQ